MNIGVVGAGKMGAALASLWSNAGHTVTLSAGAFDDKLRETASAAGARAGTVADAAGAEVVMLAVQPQALTAALDAAGDLEGRVVITCISGLRPDFKGETIGMPTDLTTSIAETISAARPRARIVEAFNTTFAEILAAPSRDIDGERPSLFYCGDDARAKNTARGLIIECGYAPIDAGPLRSARTIETLASVWVQTAVVSGLFPIVGLRILHSPAPTNA